MGSPIRYAYIIVFSCRGTVRRGVALRLRPTGLWATIGQAVGQRDLAVTANTYTHVLTDERELDYEGMLP